MPFLNSVRTHGSLSIKYKKLRGYPFYRIRVGDYRVIYSVDENSKTVYVVRIGKRDEVYRNIG